MKKALAFILVFQFLGLPTFAKELGKLPALLEHYFDHHHHHHHSDLKSHLLTFVSDHYGVSDHGNRNDHSDLPFKKNPQQSVVGPTLYLYLCETQPLFSPGEEEYVGQQAIGRIPAFISNYHQAIWQPPKISEN